MKRNPQGAKKRVQDSRNASRTSATRGMRRAISAPTLDVSHLIRAAKIAAQHASCDALLELDDSSESDASDGTEVVALLEDALEAVHTDDSADHFTLDDETDDEEEAEHHRLFLNLSLPFCGSKGATKTPSSSKRRIAKKDTTGSKENSQRRRRSNHPLEPSDAPLIPPPSPRALEHGTVTIVLDLDETVVWARNANIVVRPFVYELLNACMRNHCEVVLWTAGVPQYVNRIIHAVNRIVSRQWFRYVVCRSSLWFNEDGQCSVKDLRYLQRNLDRVLVIENSPASMQLQCDNVLLVEDFYGDNSEDQSLIFAGQVVDRVCAAVANGATVAEAIQSDPVVVPLTFDLAPDHSATGEATTVTSMGLRYCPRGGDGRRVFSGVSPKCAGS